MTNKVVFITGSAKRLGAYTAKHLHNLGFNLVLHCNQSVVAAELLLDELNSLRADSAKLVRGDLTDVDKLGDIASEALTAFGRLDVLINNASSFYATPVGTITHKDWLNLVGSNMQAPLFLSQYCFEALAQNNGLIVNMVDIHAQQPLKEHTLYCMAKSALVTMTKSLAQELAPDVRVNGVAPGAIMWPENQISEADKQQVVKQIPAQRLGSLHDIAQAIEYLIQASYVTGQIIAVDGGRSISSFSKA
jgi:pteridine reductase